MRDFTTDTVNAITSQRCWPILLVSCGFLNETVYLWTGIGVMNWNGQAWQGVGSFGGLSTVTETTATQAQGITLTLSGIPTELLTDAMSQMSTSKQAQVFLGFVDANRLLIDTPITVYQGLMDQVEVDVGTDACSISIAVENRLSDLQRARGGRYTDQDQKARHPSDNGLKWVSYSVDALINWHSN